MSERFIVRFSEHLKTQAPTVLLYELSEISGAVVGQLANGSVEIKGFKKSKAAQVLEYLRSEQARGALQIEATE